MACIGNAKETCGGSNGLSLYELTSAYNLSLTATSSQSASSTSISSSSKTSSSSVSVSSTTLSTSTTATTSASSVPSGISAYSYVACWTDIVTTRTLNASSEVDYGLTVERCALFCNEYTYFGVEYGRECESTTTFFTWQKLTNAPKVTVATLCWQVQRLRQMEDARTVRLSTPYYIFSILIRNPSLRW
jgi:hypothetical protein